jgi:hypothetical protein
MVVITVKNHEEFKSLVHLKDFRISKAIVEAILKNLKGTKKFIYILTVEVEEDNATYDITIRRSDFLEGLKRNLKYYEINEQYEDCREIVKAIKFLKKKTLKK